MAVSGLPQGTLYFARFSWCFPVGRGRNTGTPQLFLDAEHDCSIIFQASPVIADRTVILILVALGPIRRLPEILSCYRMPTENDGQNAAAKIFRDNADVNRMQYEVTCRLEEYAKEEFGINIRFTSFKWEQWFKGWAKWFIGFLK